MTLSGWAAILIVPPVNLAVVAALAIWTGRRRLAGWSLTAFLLLGLPIVADALETSLALPESAADATGAQAIVVLGGEVERDRDGHTLPGLLSTQRLRMAAGLARRTGLPILVSGGVTRAGAAPVAMAMAESLRRDFAIAPRWIEDASADTMQNAAMSAAMLQAVGISRILVVTQAWHMRRALLAFSATGMHAEPAAADGGQGAEVSLEGFVPTPGAWLRSYYSLHEWVGLGWYAIRLRK